LVGRNSKLLALAIVLLSWDQPPSFHVSADAHSHRKAEVKPAWACPQPGNCDKEATTNNLNKGDLSDTSRTPIGGEPTKIEAEYMEVESSLHRLFCRCPYPGETTSRIHSIPRQRSNASDSSPSFTVHLLNPDLPICQNLQFICPGDRPPKRGILWSMDQCDDYLISKIITHNHHLQPSPQIDEQPGGQNHDRHGDPILRDDSSPTNRYIQTSKHDRTIRRKHIPTTFEHDPTRGPPQLPTTSEERPSIATKSHAFQESSTVSPG